MASHEPPPRIHSISDMRVNEYPKLRVLIASNGSTDVAQAHALVVRLSKNRKIETRAIIDDVYWPGSRLSLETITVRNRRLSSAISQDMDDARETTEQIQIQTDLFQRQAYELAEWADMLVLAPIDVDTFAKMLHGITDCLLLEILRGWDVCKKILLVPGMTTSMWEHPLTKKQLSKARRKLQWVRVMTPILWQYDVNGSPKKSLLPWDGFNELVDVIRNQAELMALGHDVDIIASGTPNAAQSHTRTDTRLPTEIWSMILERVGDWEISKALNVYVNLPIPPEWQRIDQQPRDELQIYMRSLEWTILTSPSSKIISKLEEAPENMKFLSSLSVKLIIKFCMIDILSYLETNLRDVFWASFSQKLLPTLASAVYGRTEILQWWHTSPSFLAKDYAAEAMDGASKSGFVHVLDWWRKSGLPLKYTESAMEQASSKGHTAVLEWWKQASMHQGSYSLESDTRHRHSSTFVTESDGSTTLTEIQPTLRLYPGKSLLTAAQNNQTLVLRWWDNSGIPVAHSESVAKVASQHGHVAVLDTWRELKGEKMAFDSKVLVDPTKNGHLDVLQWWKDFSRGTDGRPAVKVEYKTCDIEEALEDCVRNERIALEVKKWWAQNGLNLGLQVHEWTRVKVL